MHLPSAHLSPVDDDAVRATSAASWIGLAVLVLLGLLAWLDRGILSLMVDPVRRDLGVTEFQFGLLHGLGFALFYAVCGLPLGWVADKRSRRGLIYASATIWSIAAAACGLTQNFWQMLFARFAVGFGEAGLVPASFSLVGDMFSRNRQTLALTIYSFSSAIGPAAATMIGGLLLGSGNGTMTLPLLGETPDWRGALIVTGLPGLLLAPLVFIITDRRRRATLRQAGGAEGIGLLEFLRMKTRFIACHFTGFGVLTMIAYGSAAWTPAFLMRVHGWTPTQVGLMLPLFSNLPAILASLAGAFFVDRAVARGRWTVHFDYYAVGAILIGLGGVLAFCGLGIWATAAGLSLAFAFLAAGGIAQSALQLATPPHLRGRVSALFLFATTLIGAGFGPPIVAAFTQFVYHDDMKVGLAIATTYALFAPVSVIAFLAGRSALRVAISPAP